MDYQDNWQKRHQGTDRVSGSHTADMRSALADYFCEDGHIIIATEAGAKGIKLQFNFLRFDGVSSTFRLALGYNMGIIAYVMQNIFL
jgi:hypothetical protein